MKFCSSCELGKNHSLHFTTSSTVIYEPFALVYFDIWGLANTTSRIGFRYYINFVDAFSRFT